MSNRPTVIDQGDLFPDNDPVPNYDESMTWVRDILTGKLTPRDKHPNDEGKEDCL